LIERMLDAHPAVLGLGEHPALHALTSRISERLGGRYPTAISAIDLQTARAAANEYRQAVTPKKCAALRIINKDLGCFLHQGFIASVLPGARVIVCRRNPLDHCIACFFERLRPSSAPYATALDRMGHFYIHFHRLMAYWREHLPLAMHEVQYEAVTAALRRRAGACWSFSTFPSIPPASTRISRSGRTARSATRRFGGRSTRPAWGGRRMTRPCSRGLPGRLPKRG